MVILSSFDFSISLISASFLEVKSINEGSFFFPRLGTGAKNGLSVSIKILSKGKNLSENKKIIGIGDTGLDYYYENSDRKKQIESFKIHINAAIENNLPLIVHSRNAEENTFDILNEYKDTELKILMHCFTGSQKFAENLLNLNTYFSASGIITFKNSKELQKTFKFLPLDRILIETDSPFLAPVPNRGKKNEPSFINFTSKKLAEIKTIQKSKLDKITTENFDNLFFK